MNSFYASVEMANDPKLKGKPLAIAGNPEERRGIIVTCSYEARAKGVKTTMPLWEAKKLCPDLIVLPPNFDRYRENSLAIFSILQEYTPLVEPVSIDEGYLDVTNIVGQGNALTIATEIQQRLLKELDLPCSIGIAPNKFLAKTASDMKKPLGITILRIRDIPTFLWPLKVEKMHGIGLKTASKLNRIGIETIYDLAHANDIQLKALLGINGIRLKERANGIDKRPVDPNAVSDFKSIGNSTTLPKDVTNEKELLQILASLSDKVSVRMKRKNVVAHTISVTIRFQDRKTITRSRKLDNPVDRKENIYAEAKSIFLKNWNGEPIRLLGVTGTDLIDKEQAFLQLDLFTYQDELKKEPLIETIEQLKEKYGSTIIEQASKRHVEKLDHVGTETSFNKDFFQVRKKR